MPIRKPDPKIKPIVELLKKNQGLTYIISSAGEFPDVNSSSPHSDSTHPDVYAHVFFEMPKDKEPELEKMIRYLLSRAVGHWSEFMVEFNKEYYVIPETIILSVRWKMEIVPFSCKYDRDYPISQKIEYTKKGITFVEEVLRNYFK